MSEVINRLVVYVLGRMAKRKRRSDVAERRLVCFQLSFLT
jgi:hypothetical protein